MNLKQSHLIATTVFDCFASDPAFIEKWHVLAGQPLVACVDKTVSDLQSVKDLKFFEVLDRKEVVGYIGIENVENKHLALTGFFLKPSHRTREGLSEFWSVIKDYFEGRPFMSGVYTKNRPANKFLQKMGGKVVAVVIKNDNPGIIYGFNLKEE